MKSAEPIDSGVLPPCVGSIPPVSTTWNARPFHSASPNRRSRVVPGVSSTMARRSPTRRLNKVLFPTLGRPTSATIGFDIRFMLYLRFLDFNSLRHTFMETVSGSVLEFVMEKESASQSQVVIIPLPQFQAIWIRPAHCQSKCPPLESAGRCQRYIR